MFLWGEIFPGCRPLQRGTGFHFPLYSQAPSTDLHPRLALVMRQELLYKCVFPATLPVSYNTMNWLSEKVFPLGQLLRKVFYQKYLIWSVFNVDHLKNHLLLNCINFFHQQGLKPFSINSINILHPFYKYFISLLFLLPWHFWKM